MLQPPSQATPTQVSPTPTPAQAIDGPITRSRAKKLQQEVHTLLCEIHFNIHENYILPKSCTLLLLRFTKEDDKDTPGEDYKEEPRTGQHSMTEPSERIGHHFLLPKAMKDHEDLLKRLSKSSFQCNKCRPIWSFRLGGRPVLVKTGQQFISLHDDQIPVQNCIIVKYFVVHAAHGVKAYQVNFPTQQTTHLLEVPRRSYCQNTEDCTEVKQPRGNPTESHFEEAFHIVRLIFFFSCLYLSRRAAPPCSIAFVDNLIFDIHKPFVQLCANKYSESDLYPFALVISLRDYRSGGFIRSQLVLLLPLRFSLIDYRLCWFVP
jgi:hypothetical protein